MAFSLSDPKTQRYLLYGVPVVAVIGYVLYRKNKSAAPTSTTAPITSSGDLTSGQLSDLQQGYAQGFNQLQSQLNALANQTVANQTQPSGAPTGTTSTVSTQITGPPIPISAYQNPATAVTASTIQPSYLVSLGLTPDQISGVLQPQNQPSTNPNVSAAPTVVEQPGAIEPQATGVGQRELTPGPNPFPVTYG